MTVKNALLTLTLLIALALSAPAQQIALRTWRVRLAQLRPARRRARAQLI